jgi:putative hydrolase of the HAD superfamily
MHLLLDVDGVLQFERPDLETFLVEELGWAGDHQAFRDVLFSDMEYHNALRGKLDLLQVLGRVLPNFGVLCTPERYLEAWVSDFLFNEELLQSLRSVRCANVCLASNQERRRSRAIANAYASYGCITRMYFSCDIGYRKPELGFFQHIVTDLGVRPNEVVFVDDLAENVEAAASLGIRSIRYDTNKQFCMALQDLGLLLGTNNPPQSDALSARP